MKANEFVKKHGLEAVKKYCLDIREAANQVQYKHSLEDFGDELQRLVESHEIVDNWRGLEKAMDAVTNIEANGGDMNRVAQAIADVEACQ